MELKELENHIQSIINADKGGGIINLNDEAMKILAMCNFIQKNILRKHSSTPDRLLLLKYTVWLRGWGKNEMEDDEMVNHILKFDENLFSDEESDMLSNFPDELITKILNYE